RHAPAYAREPGPRQALPVPIVKFRNDLAFQKIVEAFGVASVDLRCLATPFVANRPPEPRLESLVPPTVQCGTIQSAVHEHFHAARAAGLPWPARRVDPDINPMHQFLGERDIVVLQKNHAPAKPRLTRNRNPGADDQLSFGI